MLDWLRSTPRRIFVLVPIWGILFELAVRRGALAFLWGVVFLVWGYLQYRLAGVYRICNGGGGPGLGGPLSASSPMGRTAMCAIRCISVTSPSS